MDPTAKSKLREAIEAEMGKTIDNTDGSRFSIATRLRMSLQQAGEVAWTASVNLNRSVIGETEYSVVEGRPGTSFVRYSDPIEQHGPFVLTRGEHTLQLPRAYRLGQCLVEIAQFLEFVEDRGYHQQRFWTVSEATRRRFTTGDGQLLGPGSWPSEGSPDKPGDHPVAGNFLL